MKAKARVKSKKYGSTRFLDIETVIKTLKKLANYQVERVQEINARELAEELGLGRSTFLDWLKKKYNLTYNELREKVIAEIQEKRAEKLEKKELKLLPPKDFKEFIEMKEIKNMINELKASGRTEKYVQSVVSNLWRVVDSLRVHPRVLLESMGSDNDIVRDYLANINNENIKYAVKNALRVFAKVNGGKIPLYLELPEYQGKYQNVIIEREARERLVQLILKNEKEGEKWVSALDFLYYTGSRAEALTNAKLVFENEKYLIYQTAEKGKKGRKIIWRKVVRKENNPFWNWVKKYIPLSIGEVKKLRSILSKYYDTLFKEGLITKDTYNYAKKHPLHVWRHTSCLEHLRYYKWNISVVAKLLGWKNPKMIIQVYGDIELDLVLEWEEISEEEWRKKYALRFI